jgi:hypothetical protein
VHQLAGNVDGSVEDQAKCQEVLPARARG